MKKTFKLLNYYFINELLKDNYTGEEKNCEKDKENSEEIVKHMKYLNFVENSTVFYIGCMIHNIQLIVLHAVESLEEYKILLSSAVSIAKFFNRSCYKNDLSYVKLPIQIRWNFIFDFFQGFMKNYESNIKNIKALEERLRFFDEVSKIRVNNIIKYLKPFYQITKKYESENNYLGDFYYDITKVLLLLQKQLSQALNDKFTYISLSNLTNLTKK